MPENVRGKIVDALGQAALDRLVLVLGFSHRNVSWYEHRTDEGDAVVGLEGGVDHTQTLSWMLHRVDASTWLLVDAFDGLQLGSGSSIVDVVECAIRAARDIVLGLYTLERAVESSAVTVAEHTGV